MKQFFEFLPVGAFVIAYIITRDIFISTGVLMAALLAQVVFEYAAYRQVEKKTLIIFAVAVVFGGATLLFRDEIFILWKPTIVNWLFAMILLTSQLFFQRNLLQAALGSQLVLPAEIWRNLAFGWSGGFFLAGVLNLVVAYNFTLDFWVTYKLIGGFATTLFYIFLTFYYLHVTGHLRALMAKAEARHEATAPEKNHNPDS